MTYFPFEHRTLKTLAHYLRPLYHNSQPSNSASAAAFSPATSFSRGQAVASEEYRVTAVKASPTESDCSDTASISHSNPFVRRMGTAAVAAAAGFDADPDVEEDGAVAAAAASALSPTTGPIPAVPGRGYPVASIGLHMGLGLSPSLAPSWGGMGHMGSLALGAPGWPQMVTQRGFAPPQRTSAVVAGATNILRPTSAVMIAPARGMVGSSRTREEANLAASLDQLSVSNEERGGFAGPVFQLAARADARDVVKTAKVSTKKKKKKSTTQVTPSP
jgi:hypothetical protein